MTSILRRFTILVFVIFALWNVENAQTAVRSKDLPNLYKINEKLYRGGQPTEAGIAELKKMGIKTVIDLRDDDDRAKKEGTWVHTAGLRFVNVPLSNWRGPKEGSVEDIIKQLDLPGNQPVFIHCKRGADRTGTVIAVYRMTHDGWTADRANEEAEKFGFGWWQFGMKHYINDYYRDHIKAEKK